ncbi:putative ORFan [Tupanvirus deep ocean]|uniref:ORFan n=2 Tax=Tupanvirus TaxID=2094720 RepID=A0AC62A9J0_9VIRU|nr:putative ORFan [Tupanvirus deep ocean]QKU34441.1 putative ORFan [Tupanvirus deep ocean]
MSIEIKYAITDLIHEVLADHPYALRNMRAEAIGGKGEIAFIWRFGEPLRCQCGYRTVDSFRKTGRGSCIVPRLLEKLSERICELATHEKEMIKVPVVDMNHTRISGYF